MKELLTTLHTTASATGASTVGVWPESALREPLIVASLLHEHELNCHLKVQNGEPMARKNTTHYVLIALALAAQGLFLSGCGDEVGGQATTSSPSGLGDTARPQAETSVTQTPATSPAGETSVTQPLDASPADATSTPGTGSADTGGLPGAITLLGQQGSPAVVVVPPPGDARQQIEALKQKFGIRSIGGSNATPAVLATIDQEYAALPAGSFRDLDIVFEAGRPSDDRMGTGRGVWMALDRDGREKPSGGMPFGGRITYVGRNVHRWTLVHEITHHITIYLDPEFAGTFLTGIGYGRTRPDETAHTQMDYNYFRERAVAATSFPTRYSRGRATEHIAECSTTQLIGIGALVPWDRPNPQYALPEAAKAELSQRLPSSGGRT